MVLSSLYIALSIGANDETMSAVAGSRFISVWKAAFIGGVCDFLGAVLIGRKVEETIGRGILAFDVGFDYALAILVAMALWLTVSSLLGFPVSTTHSVIGSAIGVGVLSMGLSGVNWGVVFKIIAGMLVSPLFGFAISYVVYSLLKVFVLRRAAGVTMRERAELVMAVLLTLSSAWTSFSRGGNDIGNATAFILHVIGNPALVRLLCGFGMMLGLLTIGRRVIANVGMSVVGLTPGMALSAQFSTGLLTFAATLIGLPLSGSQILVASLVGVGYARRMKINVREIVEIVLSWILTFPVSALISAGVLTVVRLFRV